MSIISSLEEGIDNGGEDVENFDSIKILNPFLPIRTLIPINDSIKDIDNILYKDIKSNFDKVYILCLKEKCEIKENFYNNKISINELKKFKDDIILYETEIKILQNSFHLKNILYLNNEYINIFNHFQYQLNDKELVLVLLNLKLDDFKIYDKQFVGITQIEEYFKLKIMNNFYNQSNYTVLLKLLDSNNEFNFWAKKINCKLNLSKKIIDRRFNYENMYLNDTVLSEYNRLNNSKNSNYLDFLFRKEKYIDISSTILKKKFKKYIINDEDIIINNKDIIFILLNIKSRVELYKFVTNMIASKKYNHLILNNSEALDLLSSNLFFSKFNFSTNFADNFIQKYIYSLKYVIGYAWITLYMEESIKKRKMTDNERFIFSIDTASKLPNFPFSMNNIKNNPYISLLLNNDIINIKKNCTSLKTYKNYKYGINNFNTFIEKLNIFVWNRNINIFEDLNWDNIAISGSIIPACITLFNPLTLKYDNDYNKYFNHFYKDSDIDIMCNIKNNFKFFDKVIEIQQNINNKINNIVNKNINIEVICNKNITLIINKTFIENIIYHFNQENDKSYSIDDMINGINNNLIKQFYYNYYVKLKIKDNEKYFNSEYWNNIKYSEYFNIGLINNFRVVLKENRENVNNELVKYYENHKFRLKCNLLNHELEIFQIKYDNFASLVSQFHLPCVRGFYKNKDVKLLPSCITAAHTLINMDYKYFAGTNNPIDIITKYRRRGYTTILNDYEIINMIDYISVSDKWKKQYNNFNIKKNNNILKILGPLNINDHFFGKQHKCFDQINIYIDIIHMYKFYYQIKGKYQQKYDSLKVLLNHDFNTIDYYGYIKPLDKLILDMLYKIN